MDISLGSDLHLEFGALEIINTDKSDTLIISGDATIAQDLHDHPNSSSLTQAQIMASLGARQETAIRFREFFRNVSEQFKHVIYVAGNHEFYHGKWYGNIDDLRQECAVYNNIHFLECNHVIIDGVLFVGGTLWTDMNKQDPFTLHAISNVMNDFRIIRNDRLGHRRLTPMDTVERHFETLRYIKTVIDQHPKMPTVVVGHHAPSFLSISEKYKDDRITNGAYASDLSDFILDHPQICLWTHGHVHHKSDYHIGSTRIMCNPRGYIGYEPEASNWKLTTISI